MKANSMQGHNITTANKPSEIWEQLEREMWFRKKLLEKNQKMFIYIQFKTIITLSTFQNRKTNTYNAIIYSIICMVATYYPLL